MNIIFFGTPSFVVPVLEKLYEKYTVTGVVTAPDKKVGRKQLLTPSPVKQFAIKNAIPVFDDLTIENFKSKIPQTDLFVVAAYGKIIPQEILDIPKFGAVNIHPSHLPQYRGPSPLTETIKNGDTKTAISFILMDAQMDHGAILKQIPYQLTGTETFATLAEHIFTKSAELLPDLINDYVEKKLTPAPQDDSKATYTKMVTKQDGFIDLENPPSKTKLQQLIRAYYPWPTVWTRVNEKIIKFLPNNMIQMEGKNPVTLKDFLNGYPETKEVLQKLI